MFSPGQTEKHQKNTASMHISSVSPLTSLVIVNAKQKVLILFTNSAGH